MLTLFLIVFIDLVGFGIIIPLLPFFGEHFDASPAVIGLLMASYSLTQFIAAPFWGRASDRIGRRPVLLITLAGASASYVLLGFSNSLWMLFLARALGGFMAGNISTAFAYVADITTPENRTKGMGVIHQQPAIHVTGQGRQSFNGGAITIHGKHAFCHDQNIFVMWAMFSQNFCAILGVVVGKKANVAAR